MSKARLALKCDCCGRQTLAEVVEGKLVIKARRHGKTHIFSEAVDRLALSVQKGDVNRGSIHVTDQAQPKPQPGA